MMSEFNIDLPNCWGETKSLRVIADISRAEPDVGIFGNGKISLAIEEIYCLEDGFDEEENIIERFDEERIEDIAHQIYNQFN